MKRDAVRIDSNLRSQIVQEFAEKLSRDGIEVLVAALNAKHLHLLARFPDHNPRHWIGRAKKHTSHILRQCGLRVDEGGLWAKRSRAEPILDRRHQISTFRYIERHSKQGASIWKFSPRSKNAPDEK
jgi:REP element-mobilizing transposase RayT